LNRSMISVLRSLLSMHGLLGLLAPSRDAAVQAEMQVSMLVARPTAHVHLAGAHFGPMR